MPERVQRRRLQGWANAAAPTVHSDGGNDAMADTSAKYRTWSQDRANDFAMFKL